MRKERRILICESNGKKITIPDVSKIIMALRDGTVQHQASIDINVKNIKIIRRTIRR